MDCRDFCCMVVARWLWVVALEASVDGERRTGSLDEAAEVSLDEAAEVSFGEAVEVLCVAGIRPAVFAAEVSAFQHSR